MKEKQIAFDFQARYCVAGAPDNEADQIWFVLHGYGQLAKYFIKKFDALARRRVKVIAPEGLSRFYLEPIQDGGRKNNRVGATWMTREHREADIRNYVAYLDAVYRMETTGLQRAVTVLGFSQGAATASRWAVQGNIRFAKLVLWAGIFPPDMDFGHSAKIFSDRQIFHVYGKQDPFLTGERLAEMDSLIARLNTRINTITFDGGHDIDEGVLLQLT